MKKKKIISVISISAIISILSGCSSPINSIRNTITSDNNKVEELYKSTTTDEIKDKYSSEEKYQYDSPINNVSKDTVFTFDMNSKVKTKFNYDYRKIYKVFADSNLTQDVHISIDYNNNKGVLEISPTTPIAAAEGETKTSKNTSWGNVSNMYLVRYYDLETAEELEKPIVTVISFKSELEAPAITYDTDENGNAKLTWDKIDGAEKYIIYKINNDEYFSQSTLYKVAETNDCTFSNFVSGYSSITGFEFDKSIMQNTAISGNSKDAFCVVAIKGDKKSDISNLINLSDLAKKLPYAIDIKNNNYDSNYSRIGDLPSTLPIKMRDDSTINYILNYDIENIEEERTNTNSAIKSIKINATIPGTTFKWTATVNNINNSTYKDQLKDIKERQDALLSNGVTDKPKNNIKPTSDDNEGDKKEKLKEKENNEDKNTVEGLEDLPGVKVNASSSLCEYLAVNMLNRNEKISLDDFNEASDRTKLTDALYEAYYQNPLILSLDSFGYSYKDNCLVVKYKEGKETYRKKQKDILNEVKTVSKEIIKKDMSDYDKELAINEYICEIASYDNDALESAKANGMRPDDSFNDSFTPYGVLINKKGVCASYAAAFKLLADSCELPCVVVTGTLSGGLGHAWNRVKLEDNWLSTDATNNDLKVRNSLFNLPDDMAKNMLVEDDKYMQEDSIKNYKGTISKYEYYTYNNLCVDKNSAADTLEKQLKESGSASVRIKGEVSDKDIKDIYQKLFTNCLKDGMSKEELETLKGNEINGVLGIYK